MSDKNDSDQNFNDAELQDIMSEIESLEKEFVDDDEDDTSAEDIVNELETAPSEEVVAETSAEDTTSEAVVDDGPENDIVSEADIESISQEMVSTQQAEESPMNNENVTELHVVQDDTPVANTTVEETTMSNPNPGEMTFQGSGKLDLNLSFYIGDQKATLKVVDGVGLTVDMAGTTLKFDSDGCHVDIEGGANINLPLANSKSAKKAA